MRFEDSRTWTDDVRATELFVGFVEGMFELRPDRYVGLDEDGAGFAAVCGGVLIDEGLGFGAEGDVGYEDVAAFVEEEAGEGERYT